MTATTVGGVVYLFATYQDLTLEPGVMRLNSGGLTYCIDEVEHLAELDHTLFINIKEMAYGLGTTLSTNGQEILSM